MKYILLHVLIVLSAVCSTGVAQTPAVKDVNEDAEAIDIYLLIGQSNMQGVAPIEDLDKVVLEKVFLFNDKESWEQAVNLIENGINRYSTVKRNPRTLLGPGYTFGRKLAEHTGATIGIVSNARGATRIEWWQKGYEGENDYDLYEEAVKRAKRALQKSPSGSKIKGILWHQGEGNNGGGRHVNYKKDLQALITNLRSDLGDSDIAFIVGEVGKWNERGLNVNPILSSVKTFISNADWVSSDGLTTINLATNDPHFDNLSQRVLGGRYADKAASLIYNIDVEGVSLFSERNYGGRSVVLRPGTYTGEKLESMGILPEEISSVKVDEGYELTLYCDAMHEPITSDQATFNPHKINSLRITKKIK